MKSPPIGMLLGLVFTLGLALGFPKLMVYWRQQTGLADLERARYTAQAEVERAKGVAQANQIIGESLHKNEDYLRYLWIQTLHETKNQVIYVPTEGNLPILEATRLKEK